MSRKRRKEEDQWKGTDGQSKAHLLQDQVFTDQCLLRPLFQQREVTSQSGLDIGSQLRENLLELNINSNTIRLSNELFERNLELK